MSRWSPETNAPSWLAQVPRLSRSRRAIAVWIVILAICWMIHGYRSQPESVLTQSLDDASRSREKRLEQQDMSENEKSLTREGRPKSHNQKPLRQPQPQELANSETDTANNGLSTAPEREQNETVKQSTGARSSHSNHRHLQQGHKQTVPQEASRRTEDIDTQVLVVGNTVSVDERAKSLPDFVFVPFEDAIQGIELEGWEDRWISDAEYDVEKHGHLVEPKIDFVYLWVNGSDEEFRDRMRPYELKSVLNDPEGLWMASHGVNRYRDWDELRYSFRSVNSHAGHFRNKVQIVVNSIGNNADGSLTRQTPAWLLDGDKHNVEVLAQEDFIDKDRAECLPTFNSLTIENQLFNLPSDVDHLFAMSDDMLLGAPHAPSDIFSPLFGPVMGFKTNSYSATNPPTEADAKRFGEKPFLIYTSWLLNRRFGVRKRKGQGHFGHSLSRSVMKEAITSFPRPELQSACKRFRGEPGFQLYSWYVSFHYLIERYREALLWSYIMLRSDVDGDGVLSWEERQRIAQEIAKGTENVEKSSFRKRHYYHASASMEKAGLEPPQVNTNIQWTSLDGPVSIQTADCTDFDIDECLGAGFTHSRSSAGNPFFSSANVFDRATRQEPHCGDCLIKTLLHQVRQGVSPLLPLRETQELKREQAVKALMRYKYTVMDPTNQLFVMVTDADQVDSTLIKKYVRERKPMPGQICLNDDVSTTDEDELADMHQAMSELLEGILSEKAAWER